jgi:O-6-methylguanine DNA methyltransferase
MTVGGDEYSLLETPIGPLLVAHRASRLTAASRSVDEAEFEAMFRRRVGRPLRRVPALPERLARDLQAQLVGRAEEPLRVDLSGMRPFERDALLKVLEIPRGEVRSYSWIAREIGRPAAVRAVGTAMSNNPIAVFIPCHRVVRSDGSIGEFGTGGKAAKSRLLAREGVDPSRLERLARDGTRLLGSQVTRVFCFPSCRHARQIGEGDRVRFSSPSQAVRAGYRPCPDCRPVADGALARLPPISGSRTGGGRAALQSTQ